MCNTPTKAYWNISHQTAKAGKDISQALMCVSKREGSNYQAKVWIYFLKWPKLIRKQSKMSHQISKAGKGISRVVISVSWGSCHKRMVKLSRKVTNLLLELAKVPRKPSWICHISLQRLKGDELGSHECVSRLMSQKKARLPRKNIKSASKNGLKLPRKPSVICRI